MWREQLGALGGSALCLALDFPGFGASQPARQPVCRMDEMAVHAVALLDHLGIERAVVCGLSMGGYVALALAAGFPQRLSGLVLADTRAGADEPEGRQARLEMARRVEAEGAGWLATGAAAEGSPAVGSAAEGSLGLGSADKGSPAVGSPAFGWLADALLPRLLGPATRRTRPDLVARLARWIGEAAPGAVAAAQRGMAERPDRRPGLAQIAVPALVMAGEEDTLIPLAEAEAMSRAIPGAELQLLAAAGHLASFEQPAAFNRALAAFLRRVGRA
jgi:3-oxoadipate enol-lactonase